jgi:hypothetical protein
MLEEYMARAMLEYQTGRLAQAMGSQVGELMDPAEARRRFDVLLMAEPAMSTMDSDTAAVRYALGIRGG